MGEAHEPVEERRKAAASRAERLTESARGARERARELGRSAQQLDVSWARCRTARGLRESIQRFVLDPILAYYTRRTTAGRDRCDTVDPPVVFVANHASHMDTPVILRALPWKWRHRTAVAAAADYFYRDRRVARLVSLVFNTVPVQRQGGGLEDLAHVDDLLDDRWNLLFYPEGTRSREGPVGRLHSGAAVLAAKHGLAIVPIHVSGTRAAMPPGQVWPRRRLWRRRHRIRVVFGEPIRPLAGESGRAVMGRVQAFFTTQERVGSAPVRGRPLDEKDP
jgi:1-acyl-sn-glycerol-3-phosphate acyltransferase